MNDITSLALQSIKQIQRTQVIIQSLEGKS